MMLKKDGDLVNLVDYTAFDRIEGPKRIHLRRTQLIETKLRLVWLGDGIV